MSLDNYIQYVGLTLKKWALEAKKDVDKSDKSDDFLIGYLSAYHNIIDFMKLQAPFFDVEQKQIGLDGIEPDKDLLSYPKKNEKK